MLSRYWWVLPAFVLVVLAGCSGPSGNLSSRPVTLRLRLDETTVRAGEPIKGVLVLTNSTSQTITVNQCAFDAWFVAGLTSKINTQILSYPATNGVGCSPRLRFGPGQKQYPFTIHTTYTSCQAGGQAGTASDPACTSTGTEPPLPAGRYDANVQVVSGLPAGTRLPQPVEVMLTD